LWIDGLARSIRDLQDIVSTVKAKGAALKARVNAKRSIASATSRPERFERRLVICQFQLM
jgi:hypothetical protein